MGIQRPRNRLNLVLATAVGLASVTAFPVQAQSLGEILNRLPAAGAIARNLNRQNRIPRHWHGQYPWWQDRHDDDHDHRYHRHRGETEYERQSRGLYRPGYDIDRVLRNHYNGNRQ